MEVDKRNLGKALLANSQAPACLQKQGGTGSSRIFWIAVCRGRMTHSCCLGLAVCSEPITERSSLPALAAQTHAPHSPAVAA